MEEKKERGVLFKVIIAVIGVVAYIGLGVAALAIWVAMNPNITWGEVTIRNALVAIFAGAPILIGVVLIILIVLLMFASIFFGVLYKKNEKYYF